MFVARLTVTAAMPEGRCGREKDSKGQCYLGSIVPWGARYMYVCMPQLCPEIRHTNVPVSIRTSDSGPRFDLCSVPHYSGPDPSPQPKRAVYPAILQHDEDGAR